MSYKLKLGNRAEYFFRYEMRLPSREARNRFWFKFREDLLQQADDWRDIRHPDDPDAFLWRLRFHDGEREHLFSFAVNDQTPGFLTVALVDQKELPRHGED